MKYLGDIENGTAIRFFWATNDAAGASASRTTPGAIRVYKDGDTTERTADITDTADFDGVTGLNLCEIVTTDAFYAADGDYTAVLVGAVIDGKTVNAEIAQFSIENRYGGKAAAGIGVAVAAIGVKTANLPADPAAVSDLPTAPDNTGIAAIQAKTDNLPADPATESSVTGLGAAVLAAVAAIAPGVTVAAILAADIDTTGTPLTLKKALEVITAFLAGKAAFDTSTNVLTVYGRDDTTVIATYTLTGNGEHSAAVIA